MTTNLATDSVIPTDGVVFYNLDKVRFIMKDATGLDVAYAYQDLVFADNAVFIIQFDGVNADEYNCYFNQDCIEANRITLLASLHASAELNKAVIHYKGKFELLLENNTETFGIRFL